MSTASTLPAAASVRLPRWRASPPQLLLVLCLLLLLLALASASSGAVHIPLSHLANLWQAQADPQAAFWRNVLLEVRLPRVVFAMVVGGGLAVCGAVMQALFRNPLAEPSLIGVSLGGALGAVAAIVLGAQSLGIIAPAAFFGSLLATALAYRLGTSQPGVANLLLAGVAINAICGSLIGVFTYQATDVQLRNLTFWNMGSLAGASWSMLAWLTPWVLLLSALLIRDWRALNALLLGEREAQHLGFALRHLRHRIVILCALLVGPLVAVAGTISFVGLVVPHLVRLTQGADHRWLLPTTLVGGAVIMTLADWLARIIMTPAELPIGIVTASLGGPFLLWLLTRRQS